MKLSANQPYFFPYLGSFQLINAVDRFVLYSDIDFIKGGWINRNRLAYYSGDDFFIRVPVTDVHVGSKIKDVLIAPSSNWVSIISKVILINYRKCRFFDQIWPFLDNIFKNCNYSHIANLNEDITKSVCSLLDIKTEIVSDIGRYGDLENNLYNNPKVFDCYPSYESLNVDRKTIRILEMCKMEGADQYINAIGGKKLYDPLLFKKFGVDLKFLRSAAGEYDYIGSSFIPNLSIIDVLMMNGIEGTKSLLQQFVIE